MNPVGLKRWFIRGLEGYVRTPYANKERARRRRASKAAHQARKVNQAFRRKYGR